MWVFRHVFCLQHLSPTTMSDILKTTKGGSYFDPFARTEGKHVDDADKAIYFWKKCTQVSDIIKSD